MTRLFHFAALLVCLAGLSAQTAPKPLTQRYCFACHNNQVKTAGVSLAGLDVTAGAGGKADLLERVLRKVKNGQMPPAGAPRPDAAQLAAFVHTLEAALDSAGAADPNPGRPGPHRLNRVEYGNAVRDVLGLDINAGSMLPVDDSGYGFDNIGDVLSLSSTLLDQYLVAARRVSRLAAGDMNVKPGAASFEPRRDPARGAAAPVPARLEWISEDLPFNSAGGVAVRYYFPLDAEYVLRVNFGNGNGPAQRQLEMRLPVKAGLRSVGVTFPRQSLRPEMAGPLGPPQQGGPRPQPMDVAVDLRLDGASIKKSTVPGNAAGLPRIANLTITGPYGATGPGDTESRRRIFVCRPENPGQEAGCAEKIIRSVAHRAYRRPVTAGDVRALLAFYRQARGNGGFEFGIQKTIEAILVSPDFLFRVESDAGPKGQKIHSVTPVELASRLSFFLWSSVPDDELLTLAENGKLADPLVVRQQVARMLDDPKAGALVSNFAGQWLHVRNLAAVRPDPVIFADFDESLRAGMQRETELFFESVVRENRPATDLLTADYTFLNDRMAKHYGIPNIYGSQFRRVTLANPERGGLLGQASLLTVTSPPNRTSVVQRGKWVLENLLGAPPPPPPPDVPSLEASAKGHAVSLRAALEQHRASPSCSGCHAVMDPIGFALENYNGIGQWRTTDGGSKIDASGKLPDGTEFYGPRGLRETMTGVRREEFAAAVVQKLLTYGLGRGVEYYDQPAVRKILRESAPDGYRMRDLITAVAMSAPFQMRKSPDSFIAQR